MKQLAALYSKAAMAINTENGNMVISCTNDSCWNLYIPSLTAPEFRLPFRKGSQFYKTTIVPNTDDYYPTYNRKLFKKILSGDPVMDLETAEVLWPTVDEIYKSYKITRREIGLC